MDDQIRRQLIEQSRPFIDEDNWPGIESLWQPFLSIGDSDAKAELAALYVWHGFDEGQAKDQLMHAWLLEAANEGNANAAYCAAICRSSGKERDDLLLTAAERGCSAAQRSLGACYATGDWTGPKDLPMAVYWYTRAAEQGETEAQYNLGFMHILGEGTQPNVTLGLDWLHRSAETGFQRRHGAASRPLQEWLLPSPPKRVGGCAVGSSIPDFAAEHTRLSFVKSHSPEPNGSGGESPTFQRNSGHPPSLFSFQTFIST